VQPDCQQKHDAENPQELGVPQDRRTDVAQEFGISVELLWALEDLEVPHHVPHHEEKEDEPAYGHHHLLSHRRTIQQDGTAHLVSPSGSPTRRMIHGLSVAGQVEQDAGLA
jgi:hypothetical protein